MCWRARIHRSRLPEIGAATDASLAGARYAHQQGNAISTPQLRTAKPMPRYRIHFVDHGGNVYDTVNSEHDDDRAAIEHAHRINVPSIGAGFEVWEGERLVHRHRN